MPIARDQQLEGTKTWEKCTISASVGKYHVEVDPAIVEVSRSPQPAPPPKDLADPGPQLYQPPGRDA
jgi:hypothetical protein